MERPLSGKPRPQPTADRRVRKTQQALLGSFSQLVLGRHYDEIQVGDIAAGADVGRSTFYEHYRGKDDLLVQSMAGMLDVLARATCEPADDPALTHVLGHFFENRRYGRYLLAGPPSQHVFPLLVRELADRIEERLASTPTRLPRRLAAIRTANGTLAVLRTWLAGEPECTPEELAAGLRASALN